MQTEVPNYVAEFRRWHTAAGPQKQAIVIQQAMVKIDASPDYGAMSDPLNAVTPCGKRLGDCRYEDLEAMAAWHSELAEAFKLLSGSPQ